MKLLLVTIPSNFSIPSNFDFDALARGIAKVEIDNNTIANNAYDKIAARNMQVDQFNTQLEEPMM